MSRRPKKVSVQVSTKSEHSLPILEDLLTTSQADILSGKIKFPLKVRPADHLKSVMTSDVVHQEKLFRVALKHKKFEFARQLLGTGVVPRDTDLIFNCCQDTSDEAMGMVIPILEDQERDPIPMGIWKRNLYQSFRVLFLSNLFTDLMKKAARLLADMIDINYPLGSHIFDAMLTSSPPTISPVKVRVLIDLGISISDERHVTSVPFRGSVAEFLTHGVEINDMIEILTCIRDYIEK